MPRKDDRKQISFTVTAAQHAAFLRLAAQHSMAPGEYIRRLLAQEAQREGVDFPDDLPKRGTYVRK